MTKEPTEKADASTPEKTTEFEWNGENWTVPSDGDDWPFAAVEALEQGKGLTFVRLVLGRDQMRRFANGDRTTAGDGAELMEHIIKATGGKSAGE
jgi:hypothetical protein